MITHIVFDIDGTLIDTEKYVLQAFQKSVLEIENRLIPLEKLQCVFGVPNQEAMEKMEILKTRQVEKRWDDLYRQAFCNVALFDGIRESLQALKDSGRCTLGIITSKLDIELRLDFDYQKMWPYFSHFVCASDTKLHKPYPDPMLKYLEKSGANPKETIYIGDTVYDKQCAHGAGTLFGLAVWGAHNKNTVEADYYFDHPKDILQLIK